MTLNIRHLVKSFLSVRSSHYRRTILTAKSFLAGVYHESFDYEQNRQFKINVHGLYGDFLIRNSLDCNHMMQMSQYLNKLDLYSRNEDYIQNRKEMNKVFGSNDKHISFSELWDDISAREVYI